ncbi:two-component system regulatory protein YycI [Planococcus lenghuensis]|uniref:Regulatory protein YycH-like domain-containing protein n=1 Tax=Planococcus lenghuensis TaxID=2213202 RepID=A0A1Q2L3A2_9BACL|nr:two-component system regulatory protein YycI [Planococcus lenghuensis]AQQ54909.1 hypothetical protein B0X71_18575 [Planococcus lenghuensis]
MDWSKTKTIFIIVFAILNLFLYTLYLDKYARANVQKYDEGTIEERLIEDDITYPDDLPQEVESLPYISAREFQYAMSEYAVPEGSIREVVEGNVLNVFLNNPVPISDAETAEEVQAFVDTYIPNSEEYVLWDINTTLNQATYFQVIDEVDDRPLYYSEEGRLIVSWDDEDNEIFGYSQTMLTDIDPGDQEKSLSSAEEAIQNLYQGKALQIGTEITSVELGYSSYSVLTQAQGDIYTFVPTWRIQAELADGTTEEYFVNAVGGGVIQLPPPQPAGQ